MIQRAQKIMGDHPSLRLLQSAEAVFAERGFRGATVREICKRARVNIATVNYYFGSKKNLYSAVLQYSLSAAVKTYPPDSGLDRETSPEDRLRAFIFSFLMRFLDESRVPWYGKLVTREMAEPTFALEKLVKNRIRPIFNQLLSIIGEILDQNPDDEKVRLCALSVIGQSLYYRHARPVILRLFPGQKFGRDEIKHLAEHITSFSLSALKALKKAES
jgi:TetR/AcrR family transcriptional regulator, regulator of cefoperazone and chloramphenicol sensitivity